MTASYRYKKDDVGEKARKVRGKDPNTEAWYDKA